MLYATLYTVMPLKIDLWVSPLLCKTWLNLQVLWVLCQFLKMIWKKLESSESFYTNCAVHDNTELSRFLWLINKYKMSFGLITHVSLRYLMSAEIFIYIYCFLIVFRLCWAAQAIPISSTCHIPEARSKQPSFPMLLHTWYVEGWCLRVLIFSLTLLVTSCSSEDSLFNCRKICNNRLWCHRFHKDVIVKCLWCSACINKEIPIKTWTCFFTCLQNILSDL